MKEREYLVSDYIEQQKTFLEFEGPEVSANRRKFIRILEEEFEPTETFPESVFRAWWMEMISMISE